MTRPEITVLTAVQDVHAASREQWDACCNVLGISGVVVAYERNVTTNAYLQDNGNEEITIPGSELRPRPGRAPLHELPDRARRPTVCRVTGASSNSTANSSRRRGMLRDPRYGCDHWL